jgi:hypothetical protein
MNANKPSLSSRTITMVAASAALAALSASLVTSPVAVADNGSYLGAMKNLGLSSKAGDEGLLRAGKGACGMLAPSPGLMFGRSPNWVAQTVWEQSPMLERNEAALLVNAAIDNLCPGVNPFGYAAV